MALVFSHRNIAIGCAHHYFVVSHTKLFSGIQVSGIAVSNSLSTHLHARVSSHLTDIFCFARAGEIKEVDAFH